MNKLHTLYQELYNAANSESGYRLNKQKVYFHQLSHFAGMKGGYYDEQKVKLLIVGRAVNGWGNFSANTTQEFASQAISAMETKCFDWVEFDDCGALRNNKKDDKGDTS